MNTEQANILLIVTDQQHADAISALGNGHVATPNLDRLAREGTSFTRNYCTDPVCGPSRASLLTGRMPCETGVYTNGFNIRSSIPNIGQWLGNSSDYQAVYAGKWHARMPHSAVLPGFEVIASGINCQGQIGDVSVTLACEAWLRNRISRRPFFLTAMYTQPHDICGWINRQGGVSGGRYPINAEHLPPLPDNFQVHFEEPGMIRELRGNWVAPLCAEWDERHWREYLWAYYRQVEMVDAEIGRLLDALDETGLAESTLVVFTSDHGEALGHHGMLTKNFLYDEVMRVPLICRQPGRVPAGRIDRTTLTSGLDIMATVCDCAGIAPPSGTKGESLLPALGGTAPTGRDFVACECSLAGQAIISRTHQYVAHAGDPLELLFDLEADPGTTRNLTADPAHQAVLQQHRGFLREWLASLEIADCVPENNRWPAPMISHYTA